MDWITKRVQTNHQAGGLVNDGPPVHDSADKRYRICEQRDGPALLIDYRQLWQKEFATVEEAKNYAESHSEKYP